MKGAELFVNGEIEIEDALRLILQENHYTFDQCLRRYRDRFRARWEEAENDVFAALWNLLHTYEPEKGEFGARYYSTLWLRSLDVGHNVFQWRREPGEVPGSRRWTAPQEVDFDSTRCGHQDRLMDCRLEEKEISDLYDTLPDLGPMKVTILEVMRATGSFEKAIKIAAKLHSGVPHSIIQSESDELKETLRAKIEKEYPFLIPRKERRRHVRDNDHRGDGGDSDLASALRAFHDEEDLLELAQEAFAGEG